MKRWAPLLAVAILGATTTASAFCRSTSCAGECGRDDDNCKTLGAPLFWPSLCVGFALSHQSSEHIPFSDFEALAIRSVASWSSLACPKGEASIAFVAQPASTCHTAEYNLTGGNANIVLFQDAKWNYKGADNTLAKTTVTFDAVTGEILDADIEVNHAYNEITTGDATVVYDLESILTHEFGHFIGLDHSLDFDATMNATYDPGTSDLRTVEEDDVAGVCTIYPPNRVATCEPTPHGGFSDACQLVAEEPGCSIAHGARWDAAATGPLGRNPGRHRPVGGIALGLLATLLIARRSGLRRGPSSR